LDKEIRTVESDHACFSTNLLRLHLTEAIECIRRNKQTRQNVDRLVMIKEQHTIHLG